MTPEIMSQTVIAGFSLGLTLLLPVVFGMLAIRILFKLNF